MATATASLSTSLIRDKSDYGTPQKYVLHLTCGISLRVGLILISRFRWLITKLLRLQREKTIADLRRVLRYIIKLFSLTTGSWTSAISVCVWPAFTNVSSSTQSLIACL